MGGGISTQQLGIGTALLQDSASDIQITMVHGNILSSYFEI